MITQKWKKKTDQNASIYLQASLPCSLSSTATALEYKAVAGHHNPFVQFNSVDWERRLGWHFRRVEFPPPRETLQANLPLTHIFCLPTICCLCTFWRIVNGFPGHCSVNSSASLIIRTLYWHAIEGISFVHWPIALPALGQMMTPCLTWNNMNIFWIVST